MKINVSVEITPEEIFSIGELMENKIAKRVLNEIFPATAPIVDSQGSWIGKSVKIKASTPDSEIASWHKKLERGVVYGVTMHDTRDGSILIHGIWYNKIWFELAT